MLDTTRFTNFRKLLYLLKESTKPDAPESLKQDAVNVRVDAATNKETITTNNETTTTGKEKRALYKYIEYVLGRSEKYTVVERDLEFLKNIKLPNDLKLSHLNLPNKQMYIDVDVGVARGILLEENTMRLNAHGDYVVDRVSTLREANKELKLLSKQTGRDLQERANLRKTAEWMDKRLDQAEKDGVNEIPFMDDRLEGHIVTDGKTEMPETIRILRMWYKYSHPDGYDVLENTAIQLDDSVSLKNSKNSKKTTIVRNFVYKLLLFIMERDVRILERTEQWLRKRNSNRALRGKTPIPAFNVVTVTGVLKRTIQKVNQSVSEGRKLGHRFKVVAHYMHFWDRKRYRRLYSLSDKELEKELITWCHYPLPDGTYIEVLRKLKAECVKGQGLYVEKQRNLKTDDDKKRRFGRL